MEMSIDEAIEHGKEQLEIFGGEHKEFIEISIDTMRRYQKIEQIRHRVEHTDLEPAKAYELISEVVEDGKIIDKYKAESEDWEW